MAVEPRDEVSAWRAGLRMAKSAPDAALVRERERIVELERRPWLGRTIGYLGLMGPGYMQSALTLGAGTASASLFAGAVFGYSLLWVAPVAMLIGVLMMSAIAHQTLSTGMRPFEAVRRFAGSWVAWAWALSALLASIIWHFPQYTLASSALVDIGDALGSPGWRPQIASACVLVTAIAMSALYGSSPRWVRVYEHVLKFCVWGIVLSFAAVVVATGIGDWGALVRGFTAFEIPGERNGVLGGVVALSGLGAAVGVNMLFLYPYTLLARGWGREHRRLARLDLVVGMLIPYTLATSLMVIATANTLHLDGHFAARALMPVDAARSLAAVVGPTLGRVVFNAGLLAMALSTISLHMLCCGFIGVELFGLEVGSWKYRLMSLVPAPAFLAPLWWSKMAVWVAVPTNAICGLFLPLAYIAFIKLHLDRRYLGDDRPRGPLAVVWVAGMVLAAMLLVAASGWYAVTQLPRYFERSS